MCENSDLGRQEPRGCRYIYGDPGHGDWHYCQRSIAPGGRMGTPLKPPYCARHTKVAVTLGSEAKLRAWEKFADAIAKADPFAVDNNTNCFWIVPTDTYMKGLGETYSLIPPTAGPGHLLAPKGFSHD